MSDQEKEVAVKLIEQKEKVYASVLLAQEVEKKRKNRDEALKELLEDWRVEITEEVIQERISNALMMERNQIELVQIEDNVSQFCMVEEYEWLRSELEKHLIENCQIKGIRVVFSNHSGATHYDTLRLEWAKNPTCQCVSQ